MVHILIVIGTVLLHLARTILAFFGVGGVLRSKLIIGFLVGSLILKVIDLLALGVVVFVGVDSAFDWILTEVSQMANFSTLGSYFDVVITGLVELHFFEALSILLSALSIAFTAHAFNWAMKFNGFWSTNKK